MSTPYSNTAKIVTRGNGWAIEVEINGKAGYIGKPFEGATIYPSFDEAQQAAQARGYLVVNKQPTIAILGAGPDETSIPILTTDHDTSATLAAQGIPLAGAITPQPDPVYGHTFKMPDVAQLLSKQGGT